MANLTITNNDLGSVIYKNPEFRDELLAFAGADIAAEGTILARRIVATAITSAADAGNTGDGTCTDVTVVTGPVVPLVGVYNLECIAAVTNGGTFKLEDPNGALMSNNLVMTAGAGTATVFELAGMTFTLTDGATDFIVGDIFTLTVAADGDVVYYAKDGVGGAQIPAGILTYDVTVTGAVDQPIRMMISGYVRQQRLIIDADGDGSNVDSYVLDKLRDISIIPVSIADNSTLDNQ